MVQSVRLSLVVILLLSACASPEADDALYIGSVEVVSPDMEDVVDPGARPEVLSEGYGWSEGPVFVSDEVGVLFSDVRGNTLHRWHPDTGTTAWLNPSGYTGEEERGGGLGSNGLTLDNAGQLVLAQHGDRRIARLESGWASPAPDFATIVDRFDGKRFNSPNDVVQGPDGGWYFTDPTYGLASPDLAELDFAGLFRVSGDGEVTVLDSTLTRPNGLAFSPDGGTLYVGNSDPARAIWMAYDIENGAVTSSRVFYDATAHVAEDMPGLPDGLKVDTDGRIWATGPGGVWVFTPDGEHLGTVRTDVQTANLAFGPDGTLYLTSHMYFARIPTQVTGMGF
ncbi:MAG: SMP-30/gluconolactonase/LRE family protein [Rhodothermales bacterium]|nr:SMP-30/gluconolactonase/LRE family protein [Rhodothermales bacterium]MBO6778743.1 SMP-30/gluconolactonase/LRE family protein [Rhodothermales bacterium]